MKRVMSGVVVVLAMLIGSVVGAVALGAMGKPEVKNEPATPVVLLDPLPLPVSGQVDAVVTGQVDATVSGQVEVVAPEGEPLQVSQPDLTSLETRLDDIEAAITNSANGNGLLTPANAFETVSLFNNSVFTFKQRDLDETIYVSSLTVTVDGDGQMDLRLFGPAPAEGEPRPQVWSMGDFFDFTQVVRGVTTVTFPQPIPVASASMSCREMLEEFFYCASTLSMAGSR